MNEWDYIPEDDFFNEYDDYEEYSPNPAVLPEDPLDFLLACDVIDEAVITLVSLLDRNALTIIFHEKLIPIVQDYLHKAGMTTLDIMLVPAGGAGFGHVWTTIISSGANRADHVRRVLRVPKEARTVRLYGEGHGGEVEQVRIEWDAGFTWFY